MFGFGNDDGDGENNQNNPAGAANGTGGVLPGEDGGGHDPGTIAEDPVIDSCLDEKRQVQEDEAEHDVDVDEPGPAPAVDAADQLLRESRRLFCKRSEILCQQPCLTSLHPNRRHYQMDTDSEWDAQGQTHFTRSF